MKIVRLYRYFLEQKTPVITYEETNISNSCETLLLMFCSIGFASHHCPK
jgi:hypothetical protein